MNIITNGFYAKHKHTRSCVTGAGSNYIICCVNDIIIVGFYRGESLVPSSSGSAHTCNHGAVFLQHQTYWLYIAEVNT